MSPRTTISSLFAGLLSALYGSICAPCHFPPSNEPLRYDGVLISIVCAIPDNNIRAQAENWFSTNIHSKVSGKHLNFCMPLSYCARFVITSNVTMHYTSMQYAYEQSIRLSFCEELCVYACVPLHLPWMSNSSTTCSPMLTLFTQGASSLQFLRLDAETNFFFIPELQGYIIIL